MIQTRSTIQKLMRKLTLPELMRHIAFEVEQEANHLETVGAPIRASWKREAVVELQEAASKLDRIVHRY